MDQDVDGDGAINLSTSQRPSAATTPNDGVQQIDDIQQVSFVFCFNYFVVKIYCLLRIHLFVVVFDFST